RIVALCVAENARSVAAPAPVGVAGVVLVHAPARRRSVEGAIEGHRPFLLRLGQPLLERREDGDRLVTIESHGTLPFPAPPRGRRRRRRPPACRTCRRRRAPSGPRPPPTAPPPPCGPPPPT